MEHFFSIAFTLFLVIDALGALPSFLALIEEYREKARFWVTIREAFFALILMCFFFYIGEFFLHILGVSKTTVELSGGVILLLISLRMIFSHEEPMKWKKGKPFIVPIATPLMAGPSFFAVITIFGQSEVPNYFVFLGLLAAWFFSTLIYIFARPIYNAVRDRGLLACQRLMGLLISLIAVQMFLQGIKDLIESGV